MILRIILTVFIAAVAFFLAGPIQYYFRTRPQTAAFAEMARESDEELRRVARSPTFSNEDYRNAMQRIRERQARAQQLFAEKQRIKRQTWLIALVAGPVIGGAAFLGLTVLSKRRRKIAARSGTEASPQ